MTKRESSRIESVCIPGPAGRLEAILCFPRDRLTGAALLCHPHPLYRGTMHSPVIHRSARAFHRKGHATLRFNFRGVGLSAGLFDGGRGEQDDVRAAVAFLSRRIPDLPLTLLGYSFGSYVGFRATSGDPRLSQIVGVGVPVDLTPFDFLAEVIHPVLILQGDADPFGSIERVRKLVAPMGKRVRLVEIRGADHLFRDRLNEFEEALFGALAS